MNNKTDLRILKTYEKLKLAFGAMMNETTFDDITVFDLCARAGIRRATFYKHFTDKYAFLSHIVKAIQKEINANVERRFNLGQPVEYFTLYVKEIIAYFESRDVILDNILKSATFSVIYSIITNSTYESLVEHISATSKAGIKLPTDISITASFINGGLTYLLLNWFKTKDITKEELLAKIMRLLINFFKN